MDGFWQKAHSSGSPRLLRFLSPLPLEDRRDRGLRWRRVRCEGGHRVAFLEEGLPKAGDHLATGAKDSIVGDLYSNAVRIGQLHGRPARGHGDHVAADDVIERGMSSENSWAGLGDQPVMKDQPVLIHTAHPDARLEGADIAVVDDVAGPLRSVGRVVRR